MDRSQPISGKVALITGASAGIGEACARQYAAKGCKLILTARRVEKLTALKCDLEQRFQIPVFVYGLDVRDRAGVAALNEALPQEFREIDILVNNAGLALGVNMIENTPAEDVDTMIDTNVKGILNVLHVFLPGMKQRNRGDIINISSIAGVTSYPGGSVYCASKHAVQAINTTLRMELVATKLRVCCIMPGLVDTEFSTVRFKGDKERADNVYKV